jgi:hypothetical protein
MNDKNVKKSSSHKAYNMLDAIIALLLGLVLGGLFGYGIKLLVTYSEEAIVIVPGLVFIFVCNVILILHLLGKDD